MSIKDRLKLENELLLTKSKAQMINLYLDLQQKVEQLEKENQKLKKQLEYFKSGEYYNQLRFENEMLQQVVDTNGVPSEVYDYIDCTHRNTELLKENQELNQKYLNAVADYETTMSELQELKEQLKYHTPDENIAYFKGKNESKMKINRLRSEINELKEEKQQWINLLDMFKNQQKKFIEYMNKTIEELECDDYDDEEMKGYLIQRIDTFKENLAKYKSIIGVKNEL